MPTISDYVAWTASGTYSVAAGTGADVTVSFSSVPPISDLGSLPVLVMCASSRTTRTVDGGNPFNWQVSLAPTVTVGGVNLDPVSGLATLEDMYESVPSPVVFPELGSTFLQYSTRYYRADLHTGATITMRMHRSGHTDYQAQGVIAAAVLRDLQTLPSPDSGSAIYLGGNSVRLAEPQPLTFHIAPDPSPSEALLTAACDTTTTASTSLTVTTVAGWYDAFSATDGPRIALIGLYIPTTPAQLNPVVSGPASGAAATDANAWQFSVGAAPPLVAIPSRLATIVG